MLMRDILRWKNAYVTLAADGLGTSSLFVKKET